MWGGWLVVILGCGGAIVDHEQLGDEAYRDGRFEAALAEYQTAQRSSPNPRIWAKAGAAGLQAGDLAAAVEAYLRLGLDDPTRQQEAARGLERAVRANTKAGGSEAVQAAAMVALRRAAPDRPLGRAVLRPTDFSKLGKEEAVSILPAALGAADGAQSVDRLLVTYGAALRSTTACDAATRAYRTALRRTSNPQLRSEAQAGLGSCALRLGLDAMETGQNVRAEDWFMTALIADTVGPVSHRARVGLGDTRLAQGDVLGAAIWWGGILASAGVPDSLAEMARNRLNRLADAEAPQVLPIPTPPPGVDR